MGLKKFIVSLALILGTSLALAQNRHQSTTSDEATAAPSTCLVDPSDSTVNVRQKPESGKNVERTAVPNYTPVELLSDAPVTDGKITWVKVRLIGSRNLSGWVSEKLIRENCIAAAKKPKEEAKADSGAFSKAKTFSEHRPLVDSSWLKGQPLSLKSPQPTASGVSLRMPSDRCKAGLIIFGGTACFVLARGMKSAAGQKKGTRSDGSSCNYPAEDVVNGSTPIDPPPRGTLAVEGAQFPATSYGSGSVVRIFPEGDWPAGRHGILIHAGGDDFGESIERRNTAGCVRLDKSCQEKLVQFLNSNPSANSISLDDTAWNDDESLLKSVGPFEGFPQ
jgi:hypothetical protein